MSDPLDAARAILRRHFGFPDFRPAQRSVVRAILARRDTLAVLPTGGGKSICYQVPALQLPGLTVVISPLISLMKDQVDRLERCRVPAAFLNSAQAPEEARSQLARIARGELKLLYVAPERFEVPELRRRLAGRVALLAVDEAHCISEWGHDFRPSFRRIAHAAGELDGGRPQIVALTATATPAVRADIVAQLRLRDARVIVQGFDRTNLSYAVTRCRDESEKDQMLLAALRRHDRPAIVYAATRRAVQRLSKQLTRWGGGVRALPYHAGLDDEHRHAVQDAFMRGAVDTIVATNAFGMGIDKPDVRLVVHYTMPGTLEAYYQEAGRAGRDGRPSRCILLHAPKDRLTHEWFIESACPDRATVERTYAGLSRDPASAPVIAHHPDTGAALRLLLRERVLVEIRDTGTARIRVLAVLRRVKRELAGAADRDAARLMSFLCAACEDGECAEQEIDLRALAVRCGVHSVRAARGLLDTLRDRQFLDYSMAGGGVRLARPGAPLEAFGIDWAALLRRKAADMAKLDAMQRYVYTPNCRRAFVLRYFGEQGSPNRCGGCDNCLR